MRIFSPLRRRASSLVITLALVVLLTIIAIGMFTATRMEVVASKLHLDSIRADQLAQVGQSVALARLKTGLEGTNRAWVSQPGRLVTSPSGAPIPMTNVIDLHSGRADPLDDTNLAVDLNPALLQHPTNRLLVPQNEFPGGDPAMKVRWLYVRRNGFFETNAPPAYDAVNPVVGRFAFWTDDDATKININTAYARGSATTNVPGSDPRRVSLTPLLGSGTNADSVASFRTNHHYFHSPLDIRSVDPAVAAATETNRAELTHYNHSPNLNMFGERRIVLTTRKDLAELTYPDLAGNPALTNYYLNIFNDGIDNADPASAGIVLIDNNKISSIIRRVVGTLNRTDWPIAPGVSYTSKFSGTNPDAWTVQTVADIIDYVRSKESTNEIVVPVQYSPVNAQTLGGSKQLAKSGGNSSLGTTRAPLITEMGTWVAPVKAAGSYPAQFFVEVYMPNGTIDLTKYRLVIGAKVPAWTNNYQQISVPISSASTSLPGTDTNSAFVVSGGPVMSPGDYRTLTVLRPALTASGPVTNTGGFTSNRPPQMTFFAQLEDSSGERIARGPNENAVTKAYFSYNVDATNVPISAITAMATVDPFVGKNGQDFIQQANSFSAANPQNPSYSNPAAFTPQLDADSSGNVVTNRGRVPAKKGSSENPFGIVESLAELGAVHIGLNGEEGPGVPWRTLRLQPVLQGRTELPDWALLDLFCVPVRTNATTNEYRFLRPGGNVGGAVNVNNEVFPFVDSGGQHTLVRTNGLAALVTGARTNGTNAISTAAADALVQNIQARSLANAGGNRGRAFGAGVASNLLLSPGQIVEFSGVADQGEMSERMLPDIIDLTAVRSGVFTIYSVGQAVHQSSQGQIRVLAETRRQSVVEFRELSAGATTTSAVFSKKLNP